MTWRDKLELGLKEDAAYRKDNLPRSQIRGPELPTGPGRSQEIPLGQGERTQIPAEPSARAGTPQPSRDRSSPARVQQAFTVVGAGLLLKGKH